jgi:DNA-directed RNA polymerase beta' subunit
MLMRQIGKYGQKLESQITKMRGPMRRPGKVDVLTEPVKSNLIDGHPEDDYFLTAHGARAGLVDKGLITAHSGHLLRDWIYLLQHLYIVQKDCSAAKGLDADNFDAVQIYDSRFDLEGMLIQNISNGLQFRSPYTCTAKDSQGNVGVCQKCYGYDPATGNLPDIGLPVGILAAQALGERISQETLKSFHTGGVAEKEKKGLELVQYLRKKLSATKRIKETLIAAKKLKEIFEQFPRGSRPNLIHFEVILRGYKSDENNNDLLAQMAKSQTMSKIVDMAIKNRMDDLHGAIGRIISGQMLDTGPKGVIDG